MAESEHASISTVDQVSLRYPPAVGGIETYVETATELLRDRGVNVIVHTTDHGMSAFPGAERDDISRYAVYTGNRYPIAPGQLRRILETRADVVHSHGQYLPSTDLSSLLRRIGALRSALVVSPHFHPPNTYYGRLHLRTLGRLTAAADMVVAVSGFELDSMHAAGLHPQRARIVQPSVKRVCNPPSEAGLNELKSVLDVKSDALIVSTLGRVVAHKRVDLIVRSLPAILSREPDVIVVVAGPIDGAMYSYLSNLGRYLGVSSHLRVIGTIGADAKRALLEVSSLVVSASEYEAFGIALLEALATGTPVIGARAAAIPELLGNRDDFLFPVGDANALAERVVAVLSPPDATAARCWALERALGFSPQTQFEQLMHAYEDALHYRRDK